MMGILGAREAFAPCASVVSPERESRRLLPQNLARVFTCDNDADVGVSTGW